MFAKSLIFIKNNIGQHCALLWLIVQATGTFPLPDAVTALMGSYISMADTTNATIVWRHLLVPHNHFSAAKISIISEPCKHFGKFIFGVG
jgi:hypothetical protein